ncbi:hypothetical protein ANRL3_01257 [Anaerolineae bacterium]|nr:hypothetical protein ANRL3_01257 [Anaerolineae bacterium]
MNVMNLAQLTPMSADETASLMFICGDQYLFRYRTKENGVAYKFVSPASVRAAFAEETIDTSWLSPNVRRWGIAKHGEWIVVAYRAQRHRFVFQPPGDNPAITLEVPMPGLAFLGYGQRYYVWAFKDAELKADTQLFAAPLPNVDANGAICFGSNLVPKASAQTIEQAWHLFLTSPFTNHAVNGKSQTYPDDVRKQLLRLSDGHHCRYPLWDLVSLNRTANMVIDWTLNLRGTE